MDIDIDERAPEQEAGVPAEAFCTLEDVRRIFETSCAAPTCSARAKKSPISSRAFPCRGEIHRPL